jgi:hypothetical protein
MIVELLLASDFKIALNLKLHSIALGVTHRTDIDTQLFNMNWLYKIIATAIKLDSYSWFICVLNSQSGKCMAISLKNKGSLY